MLTSPFQFTPEQKDVLLQSNERITVALPEANKSFVIIPEDEYDLLRRSLRVEAVDLPFFDCQEVE